VLKYEDVECIDLVDLDPEMTSLFAGNTTLSGLNAGSLRDARLHVHNADAMHWLEQRRGQHASAFDVVIVDLPDPNNFSLGKLYSRSFYRLLRTAIKDGGAGVVQSTSPYLAPRSYWCIIETLESAELAVLPYHAHVPSFGDWGFALVTREQAEIPIAVDPNIPLRFLNDALLPTLFAFPADQPRVDVDINRLNDQMLVHYYEQDLKAMGPVPAS
jgi:spermidine synthase